MPEGANAPDTGAEQEPIQSQQLPDAGGEAGQSIEPPGASEVPQGDQPDAGQDFVSIADAVKDMGVDVDGRTDEEILQQLVEQAQFASQIRPHTQTIQQYIQNQQQFNEWLAQQHSPQPQPQQQQQPEEESPLWNPPEFNPQWLQQVVRQDDGSLGLVPGANPAILPKVQAWLEHRNSMIDQWQNDPYAFYDPYMQRQKKAWLDEVKEQIREEITRYSSQAEAQRYIDSNRNWMFELDESNRPVIDPLTGNAKLSQHGQRFAELLAETEAMGVPVNQQRIVAERLLNAELSTVAAQTPDAEAQDAKRKQELLAQQAQSTPSSGGSANVSPDANGETLPQNANLSLEDRLRQAFQSAGVTDRDLAEVS